jgi:hypothetical protein
MKNKKNFQILRRSFLGGLAATGAGALVRPLVAQAQSATGAPQRILHIHRPCGTDMTKWFPTGGTTNWVSSPLLSSFDKLRNNMVVIRGIDCPRVQDWLGDKHGAGMLAMISPSPKDKGPSDRHNWPVLPGYTVAEQNDTNAKFFTATDKSIEQLYLEKIKALQGTLVPSIQLTSSLNSANTKADSCLRVISYSKTDPNAPFPTALWPESRPNVAFTNIFGKAMMNMDPAMVARIQAQNKSVLDYITGGLNTVRGNVPMSQVPKIDAHLTAIRELEKKLNAQGSGRQCTPPTLAPLPAMPATGLNQLDTEHYQSSLEHMQIIKTAFQCDLTRVASFTFGWGNSEMKIANVLKLNNLLDKYKDTAGMQVQDQEGHHDVSHNGGTGYQAAQYIIDKFYCDIVAGLLIDMQNTPDGLTGGTLLDNTLVVFWNECSVGNPHSMVDMPIAIFGAKFLNLQGGKFIQYGTPGRNDGNFWMDPNTRTMADFWVATSNAWGVPMTYYSAAPNDPMWNKGTVPGIYGA